MGASGRTGIVVPFSGPEPERVDNAAKVLNHLESLPWELQVGLDGEQPFSPGKARNNGVLRLHAEHDVFYFNDADSIVEAHQILDAVRQAREAPGLVFAYTDYVRENVEGRPVQHFTNSCSAGAVAISRACFEAVGGFDETYLGWGYEDLAFALACQERWPLRRMPGVLLHLWHPPAGGRSEADRDVPVTREQKANLYRYQRLLGPAEREWSTG